MNAPVSAATLSSLPTLHLLGHFSQPYTGAERELLDIQRLLQGRRAVKIWSDVPLHPCYAGLGITTIQPFAQQFPKDGALLIAGVHMHPGIWLKYTRFEQLILFYNLASHGQLFATLEKLRDAAVPEPELVFVSNMLQLSVGLPGRVARSLMDLQPFLDVAARRFELQSGAANSVKAARPFTVGRASRDSIDKHHPDDPALYRMLASRGIRVRIMGGTCLAPALTNIEGIELLPAGAEPIADFLASLDAFFYRTGASTEAYGRVVVEAMATGLPVVAHARGGYAEVIDAGVSGFLIQSQEDAYDAVMALRDSHAACMKVGAAAMLKTLEVHGPEATERDLTAYLGQHLRP